MISAKIIADSISESGVRLTTMELHFPRFLVGELNTHRVFSRNSASSRARSTKKTIVEVENDPFIPSYWESEHIGMSGGKPLGLVEAADCRLAWREASIQAVNSARALAELGLHKSLVNRVLEPFMWHTAVVTATEWDNFYSQRLALLDDGRPQAEPHFYELATKMKQAQASSTPQELGPNDWHLPYILDEDYDKTLFLSELIRISVARCAGVSYLSQGDQGRDHTKDLNLFKRLETANPPHWSPFEHVARPQCNAYGVYYLLGDEDKMFMNLKGWTSLRYCVENDWHTTAPNQLARRFKD